MDKILRCLGKTVATIVGAFIVYALLNFVGWILMNYFIAGNILIIIVGIVFLTFLFCLFWVMEE